MVLVMVTVMVIMMVTKLLYNQFTVRASVIGQDHSYNSSLAVACLKIQYKLQKTSFRPYS